MNLLNGDLKKIYLKYLYASFGSALVASIYGVVDMIMVGQYHGPEGSAAMADGTFERTLYTGCFSARTKTYYYSTDDDPSIKSVALADCAVEDESKLFVA